MRGLIVLCFVLLRLVCSAQSSANLNVDKIVKVQDSIQLNLYSIQKESFSVRIKDSIDLDKDKYKIDFSKGILYLQTNRIEEDSLTVSYLKYPSFLTKKYFTLSDSLIVPVNKGIARLHSLSTPNAKNKSSFQILEGLNTSGSISRGITIGSNQNSVFNSELDLQISGKLNKNITLKASLQDSNIPIQEGGFSQGLDEFDQVFIEISSKKWNLRAGDIQLSEQGSIFSSYTKKLQGILLSTEFSGEKVSGRAYASGALVRGVFTSSSIVGQEGNQGPYKLIGDNGELFVLIVSGSEKVYVNGLLLERGQNKDYVIDYNAGEVVFNSTFLITSDMRIEVQYQTSQQNFSRLLGVAGAKLKGEKWGFNTFVYLENDLRNQTLLQDLNDSDKQLLSEAGDDESRKVTTSVVETEFREGAILYTLEEINGISQYVYFEGDSAPEEALFEVLFSNVGQGNGDYNLINSGGGTQIYEYVDLIDGVSQGLYDPITLLKAPEKLQVAVLKGYYNPSDKLGVELELSGSKNDLNLFSSLDDEDNDGFAAHVKLNNKIYQSKKSSFNINTETSIDFVHKNFIGIERFYNIEFDRDWNLNEEINQNQLLTNVNLGVNYSNILQLNYGLQYLDFQEQYAGIRHVLNSKLNIKKWSLLNNFSNLESEGANFDTEFLRGNTNLIYTNNKFWGGAKANFESNKEENIQTQELSLNSQRNSAYEVYSGVGDSTNIYIKAGYRYRENDSIFNSKLQRVTKSNTFYVNSVIINKPATNLSAFVNYRTQKDIRQQKDVKNLNTRFIFRKNLFANKVQLNTLFESQGGTFAQQDFTFVEVDAGNGVYVWNDYNEDGIQSFDEFEISVFADQATFIRVLLPNQVFRDTYQNKYSQQVSFNFSSLKKSKNSFYKFASHFYNQVSYIIDRKTLREDSNIELNVFKDSSNDIGLNSSIRNSLFFNRGKQHFSTTYNYIESRLNSLLITGSQFRNVKSHEVSFAHKIKESWLIDLQLISGNTLSETENITSSQNFEITNVEAEPKLSYLFNQQSSLFFQYSISDKQNVIGDKETLLQQKLGTGFRFSSAKKGTITASFDWFENDFKGSSFSNVGFQLLEGLSAGTNFTWRIFVQKKITKFLELNIDYLGRKSEESRAIHTGNVQLRAFF